MEKSEMPQLLWSDFEKVEMRIGTIVAVDDFPEARKPAYQLTIDFGTEIGFKKIHILYHDEWKPFNFSQKGIEF